MAAKSSKAKVTKITAEDSKSSTPKTVTKKTKSVRRVKKARSYGIFNRPLGYFKGAWAELRQVHWPTRKATWGLTGAVLLFTAFFGVFITALDALFKFVFEQILK